MKALMKTRRSFLTPTVLTLLLAASGATQAHDGSHGNAHERHAAQAGQTNPAAQLVDGQIKKVDAATGRVTIAHAPLPNLGMPAMTMAFKVKDAKWLGQMKDGEKMPASIYSFQKTIYIDIKDQQKGDIFVYNISGQLVKTIPSARGINEIKVPVGGNYIVKVVGRDNSSVKKVWIQQ